jgi:hypothetical protein
MCELSGMSSYYLLLLTISQADKQNRYLAFLENQQSTIWSKIPTPSVKLGFYLSVRTSLLLIRLQPV